MPGAKRDHIEHLDELWDFLDQSNISAKNIERLRVLASDPYPEVQRLAVLVLDIALVHPHKRRRWRHLAARHRDLFHRAVVVHGPEFFYEVLLDYGDTGGPLWDVLEGCRVISQEDSGLSFLPIDCVGDGEQRANQPTVCRKSPDSPR